MADDREQEEYFRRMALDRILESFRRILIDLDITRDQTRKEEKYLAHCAVLQEARMAAEIHQDNPFECLPCEIIEYEIGAYVQPCCSKCQQRVLFSETASPNQAVILEEVVRDCDVFKSMAGGIRCSRSQRHDDMSYQEKTESQLLGPFRYCLMQCPFSSFRHWLASAYTRPDLAKNEAYELFCSSCAKDTQRVHCQEEHERFTEAREADKEAWELQVKDKEKQIEKRKLRRLPSQKKPHQYHASRKGKIRNKSRYYQ